MTTGYTIIPAGNLEVIDPARGVILDVRTLMEHTEKRLACAHAHVPLDELKPAQFMLGRGLDRDSDVYILCRSGKRAAQAAEKFMAEGYKNVHVIDGGIIACEDCGHEVRGHDCRSSPSKMKNPVPLERQVRISAGAFVAIGAILSLVANPIFSIIPLIVGCGLIFAGITDRCGLALVLTKAPWNRPSHPSH